MSKKLFSLLDGKSKTVVAEYDGWDDAKEAAQDAHWADMNGLVWVETPQGKRYSFRALSHEEVEMRHHGM